MIPEYKQNFGNFIPNLSILAKLFNIELEQIREIIKTNKV